MLESQFQSKLIKELKKLFPGCIVMKSDSGYLQGIPDLLILFNDKWAALECKQHAGAKKQPNQEYYVGKMDEMSFSRFICPENKEEVLHDDYNDETPLLIKEIPIDTMILTLNPEDTKHLPFGKYVYDIELTKATGEVDTFITKAILKLTEEVH